MVQDSGSPAAAVEKVHPPQSGAVDAPAGPTDPITVITNAFWDAMGAEGIPARMRRAVISRVLHGHPDGYEVGHPEYRNPGFHDFVGKRAQWTPPGS